MTRLSVLQLTWSPLSMYGGVQKQIQGLQQCMHDRGVTCVTRVLPSCLPERHPSHHAERMSLSGLEEEITRLVAENKVNVLHCHNLHCDERQPDAVFAVTRAAESAGVPIVNTVHDIGASLDSSRGAAIIEELRRCLLVATSEYNAEVLRKNYGLLAAATIPPGIRFRSGLPVPFAGVTSVVAYPARLDPFKGADVAIAALGLIATPACPMTLILSERGRGCAGEDLSYIDSLVEQSRIYPNLRVCFADELQGAESPIVHAAITLALPRLTEGFGLAPLESLEALRPVVACPSGGMDWIRSYPGIDVVPRLDPIQIAEAIVSMRKTYPLWISRCATGRAKARRTFHICGAADRYLHLYTSFLRKPVSTATSEVNDAA